MTSKENRFNKEVNTVVSKSNWMDDPHKKMLENCDACGGSVIIENSPKPPGRRQTFTTKWFRCSDCGRTLGYAEVLVEK